MYKVVHTYPVWDCGSEKSKLEKQVDYYYDVSDAIEDIRENAFKTYIEKGKSTWEGRPVDLENSSYVEDKEDPTKTCATVVLPRVRREAYYHETDLGNGLREISSSPAVILPEEHYSWKIEYFATDPDIEKAVNETIDFLSPHLKEAEIVELRTHLDSWVTFGEDIKIEDNCYPVSILVRQIDPEDLKNKKPINKSYSGITRIIFYKKKGTLCVRLSRHGYNSALLREHTMESSVTWYENLPQTHTNYLYCKENMDRILYLIIKDGKELRKKINSTNKPPRYRSKALNEAIMTLREMGYSKVEVEQESWDNCYNVFVRELFYQIFLVVRKEEPEKIYLGTSYKWAKVVIDINEECWKDKFKTEANKMIADKRES